MSGRLRHEEEREENVEDGDDDRNDDVNEALLVHHFVRILDSAHHVRVYLRERVQEVIRHDVQTVHAELCVDFYAELRLIGHQARRHVLPLSEALGVLFDALWFIHQTFVDNTASVKELKCNKKYAFFIQSFLYLIKQ